MKHPRADEDARHIFRGKIDACKAQNRTIVYIDESGFAHDMPRTHGYAPLGQRCFGTQDCHAKGRTHAIGAWVNKALLTIGLFTTHINADVFTAWVSQDLLPKLPPNCIIVMDNATFHKRNDTQTLICKAGHTLEYLPAYSPDLNPIEKKWAQAKAIRRRAQQTIETVGQLFQLNQFISRRL